MCISNVMTRGDLLALGCGNKFYIANEDGVTLEGIKIAQHTSSDYDIIIADFAELGEDGEAVVLNSEMIMTDGTFENVPHELWSFGDALKLCMEGNHA